MPSSFSLTFSSWFASFCLGDPFNIVAASQVRSCLAFQDHREVARTKWRYFIKLIVLLLIYNIFDTHYPSFSREHHMSFLVSRVGHIKDLGNLIRKNKWFFLVPNIPQVDSCETIRVFHDTLCTLNPAAPKNWHFKGQLIKLPYNLYLSIVCCLLFLVVNGLYTHTAIWYVLF